MKLSLKGNGWMDSKEIPIIYKIIDSPPVPKSANYMIRSRNGSDHVKNPKLCFIYCPVREGASGFVVS